MFCSLILCTYKRPQSIISLLETVKSQTIYPDEILVIDGSPDNETKEVIRQGDYKNLVYYQASPNERGLTKQRNVGIRLLSRDSEIVCYLDDDTILEQNYFEEVLKAFWSDRSIVGVGGVATNENRWNPIVTGVNYNPYKTYLFDGFYYQEGLRNVVRNILGLQSNLGPGKMPEFSHGRTCGFPLTGKIYECDLLIGMSFAFKKEVLQKIKFSTYFEGYGLYEDADFCIRAKQFGKLVINTNARLEHHHDPLGRPNLFKYGKMVVINGWYVWRLNTPEPKLVPVIKWHSITLLLMILRLFNVVTTKERIDALKEFCGRFVGWLSLFFKRPQ